MRQAMRARFAGLWSGVVFGVLVSACGPVSEDMAPEWKSEEEAVSTVEAALTRHGPLPEPRPTALLGPKVAYGGGKYLVVWQDVRDGGIYGARMKPDGTLLDPEGLRLNTHPERDFGRNPNVAYDGKDFVVVWDSADGVDGTRLAPDGAGPGPVFTVISSGEVAGDVGIACSRKLCLVTFAVSSDEGSDIGGLRIGPDGSRLDEFVLFMSESVVTGEPAVAWNGKEFLVVWTDSSGGVDTPDIFGARVKEDGTVLDRDGFPIGVASGAQRTPAVVWTGRRFLVVWGDMRNGTDWDIYGARVRSDRRVDDPMGIPISTASGDQRFPGVAHHNWKSLAVWDDTRAGPHRVWGARVEEDGDVRDPGGFAISGGELLNEFRPAVAYGNNQFLVPYGASSVADDPFTPNFILGRRVKHDTRVLDTPALVFTRSTSTTTATK
ncbi:hypothetical protein BO221_40580 [Archangium sp. Cb G35]|uniref:hypothetical protein n=1 Tax=Archangium sp. Cb G35 TaxID=1920190 RepID=UPI000937F8A0|nr:hypothetical protein [Archangium sp. Cb G35]OJT18372.1 hypothetical protein BO221_40580 [Archangium sp. Cb G35]